MLMLAAGQGHGLSWNDVVGERDLDAISADAERVRLAEADAALDADGDAGRDVDAGKCWEQRLHTLRASSIGYMALIDHTCSVVGRTPTADVVNAA